MRARLSLTVLLAVTVALVLAAFAGAQTPSQDSVTGMGRAVTLDGQGVDFTIAASSGPGGENPTGQVSFIQGRFGTNFAGPVTCLAVKGNIATMNVASNLGLVTLEVTDSPSGDLIRAALTGRSPSDCSVLGAAIELRVVSGGVAVVDAPPLPTSKDQCKNGGWRNFPGFKNQGDCVSFVATGGRNQPGGATG
jgi:hypothetical protein